MLAPICLMVRSDGALGGDTPTVHPAGLQGTGIEGAFRRHNSIDVRPGITRAISTSPFNSNRLLGSVALGREVSAGGSVSLNANTERVMFDNTEVNSDFERSSGFGRYEVHGTRTNFIGELGGTVVSQTSALALVPSNFVPGSNVTLRRSRSPPRIQSAGSGSLSGPMAKVELSRMTSASAKVISPQAGILRTRAPASAISRLA